MAQGARISGNIITQTQRANCFIEVSHGPVLIDNNIFASESGTTLTSQGYALVNNYLAGGVILWPKGDKRTTPYLRPHSVEVANLREPNIGGDNQLIGNVYSRRRAKTPPPDMFGGGQIFADVEGNPVPNGLKGAALPYVLRDNVMVSAEALRVTMEPHGGLRVNLSPAWAEALKGKAIPTPKATDLGVAIIPKQPFEETPGKPFPLDRDLTGAPRAATSLPGPYATLP